MRNKFQATCYKCGNQVLAGTGETNKVGEKWKTEHIVCEVAKPIPQEVVPVAPLIQASRRYRETKPVCFWDAFMNVDDGIEDDGYHLGYTAHDDPRVRW